jgi:hypothetical protein
MNLNLSKFKKLKEDDQSATLQHPAGHEIKISKRHLNKRTLQELSNLPAHFDEGGQVQDDSAHSADDAVRKNMPTIVINNGAQPQSPAMPQAAALQVPDYYTNGTFDTNKFIMQSPTAPLDSKINVMKQQDEMAKFQAQKAEEAKAIEANKVAEYNKLASSRGLPSMESPQGAAPIEEPKVPTAPAPTTPSAPQGPQDPYGTEAYYDSYTKGIGEQKAGIAKEAETLGQLGQEQAKTYEANVEQQQQNVKNFQEHSQELWQERMHFMQDYQNQKIDPNHYLNSLGVGSKIASGIGLILGGMGGGLTKTENPAMQFINNQIERDIDAQKANLGKTSNLLTANYQSFGNLRDATDMTRVMQSDIVKNQIAAQAEKSQDPLVKARAMKEIGALDQSSAGIMSQMAMRRTLMGGFQAGKMDPSTMVRMIVPEPHQQAAYKELGEVQEQIKSRDNALRAFDSLAKINTVGNRLTSPLQTPRQVNSTRNIIAVGLARATAGRVNEYEFDAAKDLYPAPGDDEKTLQLKRQNIMNLVNEKLNTPILSSYGVNVGSIGNAQGTRFNNQGEKKIQLGAPVLGKEASR